jgi:nucleotide-binding universal stress UspA family protein
MSNALLLPLDGSPFAEAALPQAVAVASRMQATLHLVRVRQFHAVAAGPMVAAEEEDREAVAGYLDRIAERVGRISQVPVKPAILEGPVVETLDEYVQRERIALVVLSTHGRRGLSRVRLGSVADALLHRLRVPMLAVRPPEGAADVDFVTPVAPGCRAVIVGLDGSALAAAILPTAEAYAAMWRAPLQLVRVVQPPLPAIASGLEFAPPAPPDPALLPQIVRAAQEELELQVRSLEKRGCPASAHVEVAATAVEGLRAVCGRSPGAVLAIATHGLSGLKRLLRGSVTDALLHDAPVPLLIWRPTPDEVDSALDREAALAVR